MNRVPYFHPFDHATSTAGDQLPKTLRFRGNHLPGLGATHKHGPTTRLADDWAFFRRLASATSSFNWGYQCF